jgi:hypothetical protein
VSQRRPPPIPWRARRPGLTALAPALLAVVALVQIVTAHRRGLTPWKGGGFGMFSTVDMSPRRSLRIVLRDRGGRETLVDEETAAVGARGSLLALPDHRELRRLAQRALRQRWFRLDGSRSRPGRGARAVRPDDPRVLAAQSCQWPPAPAAIEDIQCARAEVTAPRYQRGRGELGAVTLAGEESCR